MSSLKKEKCHSRIKKGNKKADYVRQYLNHRFNIDLVDYNGTSRDRRDGEDFGREDFTLQCKVRDKYDDIIYESDKYIPKRWPDEVLWVLEPGRDARTLAPYTIVKPRNENRFLIVKTSVIKALVDKARKYWKLKTVQRVAINGTECNVTDFSHEEIADYWAKATDFSNFNKSIILYDRSGFQMTFKIDEGGDGKAYAKTLFYMPFRFFAEDGKFLPLKDGEVYCDPSTWEAFTGEKLEDYLP